MVHGVVFILMQVCKYLLSLNIIEKHYFSLSLLAPGIQCHATIAYQTLASHNSCSYASMEMLQPCIYLLPNMQPFKSKAVRYYAGALKPCMVNNWQSFYSISCNNIISIYVYLYNITIITTSLTKTLK